MLENSIKSLILKEIEIFCLVSQKNIIERVKRTLKNGDIESEITFILTELSSSKEILMLIFCESGKEGLVEKLFYARKDMKVFDENAYVDKRKLIYNFFELSYPDRMRVLLDLELLEDPKKAITDEELIKIVIEKAIKENKLVTLNNNIVYKLAKVKKDGD